MYVGNFLLFSILFLNLVICTSNALLVLGIFKILAKLYLIIGLPSFFAKIYNNFASLEVRVKIFPFFFNISFFRLKVYGPNLTISLFGNPNCGKTAVFNLLTGLNQKVSNYPGITVEKKIANFKYDKLNISIEDYPGAYSLTPQSLDEKIVFEALIG